MRIGVRRLGFLAACFTPLIIPAAGYAVILYATADRNGAPAPGSIAETPWSLQGQWGPFLGTPIAPNYFITAVHVGGDPVSQFSFRGSNYTIDSSFGDQGGAAIAGSDLRIWKVNETFPAFAPLYGTSGAASEAGKHMVVVGRGTQRGNEVLVDGVLKGWEWGAADFEQSWGENTIEGIVSGSADQGDFVAFDFNAGVANEGTLSGFDSGGGVFVQQGTEWQLAGINYGVEGPFSYTGDDADLGFQAAIFDARGLYEKGGNGWSLVGGGSAVPASAFSSRISSRVNAIYSIIPSFAIKQQVYFVPGGATADVGTVDASTSITVGTSTSAATLSATYLRGGALTINKGSHVVVKPNGTDAAASRLTKLTFNGTTIGQFDLNNNDLIVQSTAADLTADFTSVLNRIKQGRNAATRWSGNGIASSTAAADPNQLMGLGAILNDNGHGGPIYTVFDGMTVDINSILIKYTLMGNLNLDDRVNADDFFLIDRGFSSPVGLNQYYNGDIDYNGVVNADDYTYIDRAYAMQGVVVAELGAMRGVQVAPEPSTVGILTFLSLFVARRRRRAA
ncbi:MAG TPA: PEP-CTERM sorting domain-containing protein [Tepidisphaeraceae bacterium]|jgi:hypothetical protein|nr:PEP-CTERM sorting domain-containing protein [Tepidisphaeraceae bacterium]